MIVWKYKIWMKFQIVNYFAIGWNSFRIGLNRTGHMSFLTGQHRTPKFSHTWPERILRSKSNKLRTLQSILISGTHWFQKCNHWKYSPSSFWGCRGHRGQTTSKPKMTKILLWKVIKTRWFWNFGLGDLENDL
jgi:hypothetical protein